MRRKKNTKTFFVAIMIAVILVLSIGYEAIFSFNDTEYTITVTDKERIYKGSGDTSSSKYLVFGDDKVNDNISFVMAYVGDDDNGNSLVFENTDCFIRGKWNSSNIQGQLKEGNTYKVTVVGYRVSFFSMYQNIIKIEEVK